MILNNDAFNDAIDTIDTTDTTDTIDTIDTTAIMYNEKDTPVRIIYIV